MLKCSIHKTLLLVSLLLWSSPLSAMAKPSILPIEETLAWKLMELESKYVNDDQAKKQLLRKSLNHAMSALGRNPQQPKTKADVIKVSEAMAKALAQNNFLQPRDEKDWPDTLGEAFTPKNLNQDELNDILSYHRNDTPGIHNKKRRDYIDKTKDIYYVDCDMAALIIISTAQRLGWDVRLIEVPKHNFVRWHLPSGEKVNWDWTRWGSEEDSDYYDDYKFMPFFPAAVLRGVYLRSFELAEAKAYYLLFVAGNITGNPSKKMELMHEAIKTGSNLPIVQNNFAWAVAISQTSTREDKLLALPYALNAWANEPTSANVADTVACVYSLVNEKTLAIAIEEFAISNSSGSAQQGFMDNKERIEKGELCQ